MLGSTAYERSAGRFALGYYSTPRDGYSTTIAWHPRAAPYGSSGAVAPAACARPCHPSGGATLAPFPRRRARRAATPFPASGASPAPPLACCAARATLPYGEGSVVRGPVASIASGVLAGERPSATRGLRPRSHPVTVRYERTSVFGAFRCRRGSPGTPLPRSRCLSVVVPA